MESEQTNSTKFTPVVPLHKIFTDLSLENDLKKEELDWFRSKISPLQLKAKKKKNVSVTKKVEIVAAHEPEKFSEKPDKVFLRLKETETIFFFSLSSQCEDNVDNIQKVIRENQLYEMKKIKKEIIRKRCMADVQTPRRMLKSRGIFTTEIILKDVAIFASEWDLHDTRMQNVTKEKFAKVYRAFKESKFGNNTIVAEVSTENDSCVFSKPNFQYAALVTERLLASNCFHSKQSIFKKKYRTRYDTEPTLFTYSMEPLWSFQKELETSVAVTAMDWNPSNKDLLAVGYGDLAFERESSGSVCVWSSKNPRQPEKQFHFEEAVTSLHHSRTKPNILAVGTRKGNIYVLDVSSNEGKVRLLGSTKPHSRPIWKVEWFLLQELVCQTEELLAVGENGVLMVFSTTIEKEPKEILKLEYVSSSQKYPEKIKKKKNSQRPIVLYETFDRKIFSGLCFSICDQRNFCYISTKEGAVLKCDLENPSMTGGIFLAHEGPVYSVHHSPVTDFIYLTCGADWTVKIWMEGILRPLIILQQKAPVTCAMWSPTIPTMIASVSGTELSLWDISRNVLLPMSKKNFEECRQIRNLLFSTNGANIMMGCEDGLVHVVHLSELPRIPFLQKEALINAIKKTLSRNKDEVYWKFEKSVETNRKELKTQILNVL